MIKGSFAYLPRLMIPIVNLVHQNLLAVEERDLGNELVLRHAPLGRRHVLHRQLHRVPQHLRMLKHILFSV